MKKIILTYIISSVVAVGIVLLVCGISGVLTTEMEQQEVVRYVCDGFFVSACMFICFGTLRWSSREGTFDIVGYWFSSLRGRYINFEKDWKKSESYDEYRQRKQEKKKDKIIAPYLIIGGVLAVVAIVFYLVYCFAF